MIDVATGLKNLIEAQWLETDPTIPDISLSLVGKDYRIDRTLDLPQIVIDDGTPDIKTTVKFISNQTYRITTEVKISVFYRPAKYMPDIVQTTNLSFKNMKAEISRILHAYRYSVTDINWIEQTNWIDRTKREETPIVYESTMVVKVHYYG